MEQILNDDLIISIATIVRRIMEPDYRARVRRRRVENDD